MVRLIFGQNRAKNRIDLLIWNADKTLVVGQFERDNFFLTPPVLDQQFLKSLNLRLPSGVKSCPTAKKLLAVQERIDEPEAWVVLALFILSHRTEASGVLVGDIAHEVNESLRSSGDADLTAKKFGLILKTLGIGTRKLGSPGRGIPLT